MKLTQEIKSTPTYKQYVNSEDFAEGSIHQVEYVLANPDWKSITFFADATKFSVKYKSLEEFSKQVKAISKIISKPCQCYLEAESKTICNLHLHPASDADEQFATFESTDRGWNRTR